MTTKPENTDLNLAVIGCGRWGKNHVRAASEQFGDRLRWICDIDEGRRSSLSDLTLASRFTTDVRDVLDDESTHAVIIATPAETHYALARDALEAGKHILVEKPMALVSGHARELAHLADKAERVLMPGHLLLFHPAIVKIREMIEEGTLGRLQYVYSNRLNLGSVRKHENILWSFAPHDISVLRYLTGADPIDVSAQGSVFLQPGTHDVTITHLSYPGNVHAHIHVSWLHPFKEHRLVVIGDKNMIVFEDTHEHDKLLLYSKGIDWIHGEPISRDKGSSAVHFELEEPLAAEQQHFLECAATGEPPRADATSAIAVLETLEKAQQSLDLPSPSAFNERHDGTFVHPTAVVDEGVSLGTGTQIWHFSHVQSNSTIGAHCNLGQNVNVCSNVTVGNHCKIQDNVSIYEGVELEDYVFCGPSMVFTNVLNPRCKFPQRGTEHYVRTLVRQGTSIGANATILCGHTIGRHAFIGAASVVTHDVPDHALVVGNPGRIVGWMSHDGRKLDFSDGPTCVVGDYEYRLKGETVSSKPVAKHTRATP